MCARACEKWLLLLVLLCDLKVVHSAEAADATLYATGHCASPSGRTQTFDGSNESPRNAASVEWTFMIDAHLVAPLEPHQKKASFHIFADCAKLRP